MPIPNGLADLRFRVEDKMFEFTGDGYIWCLNHGVNPNKVWCEHLQTLMSNRQDFIPLFSQHPDVAELELQIPVFPSADLWTSVCLVDVSASNGGDPSKRRWTVFWHKCPTSRSTDPATAPPAVYLCTIMSGEGRDVIRTTLIDYMKSDTNRQKTCLAGQHGFAAELEWLEYHKGKTGVIQDWCVYVNDQCLACMKQSVSASDPDLVPENQGGWNK